MKKPIPFGKYLLLERVNVGGMAEVFKAKAFGVEGFERLVAVKRILPSIAEDKEFVEMFIDEAKISVQLTHANIAQIFDLGKVGDSFFIAMEFVHGKDLRAIFDRARKRGEPLPIPMACYITMKICEGLDYAHNKRDAAGRELHLVHRDVSPQNMLISYDGEVKVIDFGIAKAAGKAGKTQAGILKGKFGYMSPEQVRGLPLDRRSDIFAVGIVLYELLTGERLFVGESDFSTLEKVRNVEIMPPSTYNRRIPDELEQIVLKALAKDVDDRYQTAMDLHDDLQSFMYTSGNFFARKDLSAYQRKAFADEIVKESARDEEYRKLEAPEMDSTSTETFDDLPSSEEESIDESPPPQPKPKPVPQRTSIPAAANVSQQPNTAPGRRPSAKPLPPPSAPPPSTSRPGTSGPPAPAPRGAYQAQPAPRPSAPAIATSRLGGPALEMEWDDDELSTQIYDKPEDAPEVMTPPKGYALGAPLLGGNGIGAPVASPPLGTQGVHLGTGSLGSTLTAGTLGTPSIGGPMGNASPFSTSATGSVSGVTPSFGVTPANTGRGPAYPTGGSPGFPSPFEYTADSVAAPAPLIETPAQPRPAQDARAKGPIIPLAIAAVALLIVVAVGGWKLFIDEPETATIQLQTVPGDAVVIVDPDSANPRRYDSRSPHIIMIENADVPHVVEVRRDGYVTWSHPITLTPGQTLQMPPVTLERSGDVARRADEPRERRGTGFEIDTDPPRARVFVDNRQLAAETPTYVSDLTPGVHRIRIEHSSRYTPQQFEINVREGEMTTLPRVVLALRSISVTFHSIPAGANVRLTRGGQVLTVGTTPVENFEVDVTNGIWAVEMSREGYQTWSDELTRPENGDRVEVRATLTPQQIAIAPPVAPPVVAPTPPTPAPDRGNGRRNERGNDRNNNSSAANTQVAAGGGMGTLRVNSVPWSTVSVDGRNIGSTPQMNIQVPAGSHTVRLVNEPLGLSETRRVNVTAGGTTPIVVRFTITQ